MGAGAQPSAAFSAVFVTSCMQVKDAFAHPLELQHPNPYWQQPPPTFEPLPDYVSAKPVLKKDEWHHLLATSTAAEMALMTATQSDTGNAPASPMQSSAAAEASDAAEGGDPPEASLTLSAALLLSKALYAPLPSHSIPANTAASANNPKSATAPGTRFKQTSRRVCNDVLRAPAQAEGKGLVAWPSKRIFFEGVIAGE